MSDSVSLVYSDGMSLVDPGQGKQDARSRILTTAAELFDERGFAAATIDEVAKRAGYSRAHVYKLFGTKENLYLETAFAAASPALVERWSQELDAADSDERALASLANAITSFDWDVVKKFATSFEFVLAAQGAPDLQATVRVKQAEFDHALGELLVRQCHVLGVEPPATP